MKAPHLDRAVVVRALVLALSAWVAFAIATLVHVQNAYWAAMPVWVVAQASRGVLVERALFRVLGTLLGAAVGFAILHIPVDAYVQFGLLGLWVALNGGLTHVLRGVHGYGALLAGITAAIVVMPAVLAPGASLEFAIARVECTLIGVMVATVITGLATPESPRQAFFLRIRLLSADAVAYAAEVLRRGASTLSVEKRRILAEISEVEASARLILAGSFEGYRRLHDVDSLMVGMLGTMSAAVALRPDGRPGAAGADALARGLDPVAEHLRSEGCPPMGEVPRMAEIPGSGRLADALVRLLEANAALGRPLDGSTALPLRRELAALAPHREWPQAGRTALASGAATFLAAALAHRVGSPLAVQAAIGVCIFSLVLGSMALPHHIAPKLLAGVAAGAFVAILYRLGVQPAFPSPPGLLWTLAPFLLVGGLLRAHPRTALAGVDFNMCFLLASQAGATGSPGAKEVVGGSAALAAAASLVAGNYILMPRRSVRQAEDAVGVIRRDLLRMVETGPGEALADWRARGARQILRLSLHLGRAKDLGWRWPKGILAVLSLGHAIEQLHELPDTVGGSLKREAFDALRRLVEDPHGTARVVRALADAAQEPAPREVLLDLANGLETSAELLNFGRSA
ncbi:FUSC family protein [Geothrix oryzisoli]|uniref:FUSC family protein n=1 Tax=Geothrix oryzisoli TaxID=2922721 RepID=UPI001FADD151|nr:FUSC family protein [Geothrix oryzisoli]